MSSPVSAAVRTMNAAVLTAPRSVRLEQHPLPIRQEGEVVVRLEGCGVCASDLPLWEGRPWFDYPLEPGAPGHEGWGVEVDTGRRVAILGGRSYAEYAAVPESDVVPLPAELDDAPFPGEALGCAMNIFDRSGVRAGATVAVVGVGFLGLLLIQLCAGAGARVLAFSRRMSPLRLARAYGAETPTEPREESCDVVIEAAGVQETLDLASRLCRTRGRLVIAGYHQDGRRSIDLQSWNWRGLDVVNAHERDSAQYVAGIRASAAAVVERRLDPSLLYTHVLPLGRLETAFELVRTRPEGFVKTLVMME